MNKYNIFLGRLHIVNMCIGVYIHRGVYFGGERLFFFRTNKIEMVLYKKHTDEGFMIVNNLN